MNLIQGIDGGLGKCTWMIHDLLSLSFTFRHILKYEIRIALCEITTIWVIMIRKRIQKRWILANRWILIHGNNPTLYRVWIVSKRKSNLGAKLMAPFQFFDWINSNWLTTIIWNQYILVNLEIAYCLFYFLSLSLVAKYHIWWRRQFNKINKQKNSITSTIRHHTCHTNNALLLYFVTYIKKVSKPTMNSTDLRINQLIQFHVLLFIHFIVRTTII